MKIQHQIAGAVLICTASLYAQENIWANFAPIASVQLQAEKYLYDTGKQTNLDQLWGRANLGLQYKSPSFDGKIYLRCYPSNFGYEPLTGASLTADDSVVLTKTKIDKIQIPEAFVKFKNKVVDVQVGRYLLLLNPRATFFGYYTDSDINGGFESRGTVYNAFQLSKNAKMGSNSAKSASQIDLIVTDDKINKGDLRVCQTFDGLINDKLGVNASYRSNIFDRIQNENAVVLHTVDAQLYVTLVKPLTIFAEAAKKDFGKDALDKTIDGTTPVLLGISGTFPKVINYAVAEFQIAETAGRDTFLWNLTLCKTVTPHLNFDLGVYSMGKSENAALGLRMNSKL